MHPTLHLCRYRSRRSTLTCPTASSPTRCLCLGPGEGARRRGRVEGSACSCQATNSTTRLVCCSRQPVEERVILVT